MEQLINHSNDLSMMQAKVENWKNDFKSPYMRKEIDRVLSTMRDLNKTLQVYYSLLEEFNIVTE